MEPGRATRARVPWLFTAAGVVTWLAAGLPVAARIAEDRGVAGTAAVRGWFVAWMVFGAAYVLRSMPVAVPAGRADVALLVAQTVAALAANFALPLPMPGVAITGVLLVIVSSGLATGVRPRTAWVWVAVQSAALLAIYMGQWPMTPALMAGAAFAGFQFFALHAACTAEREAAARRALLAANIDLRAARAAQERAARADERERIWRDVHDAVGHHLAALTLNLDAAARLVESGQESERARGAEAVRRSHGLSRLLLADIRSVMSEQAQAEPEDLASALRQLAADLPGLEVSVEASPAAGCTEPTVSHALYRCAQEFLTNSVRHSGARRIRLRLDRAGRDLVLTAEDDGRGAPGVTPGRGLRGMRERIEAAGGTLEIQTSPGRGFRVRASVPAGLAEGGEGRA